MERSVSHGLVATHPDAKDMDCDWCGAQAQRAFRLPKRATFIYACPDHIELAERTVTPKPRGAR